MKILVSIDDTDTMKMDGVEVRGTGELAGVAVNRLLVTNCLYTLTYHILPTTVRCVSKPTLNMLFWTL